MRLLLSFILLFFCCTLKAQVIFNGNFENVDTKGNPIGWDMAYNTGRQYKINVDSVTKRQGKYSVSIAYDTGKVGTGAINFPIKHAFKGSNLYLMGYIKTENVDGDAGLFINTYNPDGKMLQHDMTGQNLHGTNNWKRVVVQMPYNQGETVCINAGAYLRGKGKIWIDSLNLFIDTTLISKAPIAAYKADSDVVFDKHSGIDTIRVSKQNTVYLTLLGQLWGFLKYHHPAIAVGRYNWDAELFRLLPKYLKCINDEQVSAMLEQWVDALGKPAPCPKCKPYTSETNIVIKPNYGSLFSNKVFSKSLTDKLKYILDNQNNKYNYYVSLYSVPRFTHEREYNAPYPDAGYRLLALYRYWNIIQYYCPNRDLIPGGWNDKLLQSIPQIIGSSNKTDYDFAINRLIASIHDGHAFIQSLAINLYYGIYQLPVAANFIEDKLVVTGYYKDTLNVKQLFKLGDVITAINGKTIAQLMKEYLPTLSASNYSAQLRDMPNRCLLTSNNTQFNITLLRNGRLLHVKATAAKSFKIDDDITRQSPHAKAPGYYVMDNNIGYIFPAWFKDANAEGIKTALKNTKGIVIDMRCYPYNDIQSILINYLKPFSSNFARQTNVSSTYPGTFVYGALLKTGHKEPDNYTGKVVVIVNAITQSQAEYAVMAFQSNPNITVIGSQTAGADGGITQIVLPGSFYTDISGVGIHYPDGTNAQQVGVRINYLVKPTIKGIKAGRDELLEKAKELINSKK
jgi:C-terminal processing protease CtpA/Prc